VVVVVVAAAVVVVDITGTVIVTKLA